MRLSLRCICLLFLISACTKPTELEKEFMCKSETFSGSTENTKDVKNTFSVAIPKQWKTNLFYDEVQSSIYFADTTKQLTQTVLIDITQLSKKYQFDANFKKQLYKNDSLLNLKSITGKEFLYKENPSYFAISKGKKGNFSYQILNIFIQQNNNNSFHFKTEVFGDKEVNERFCKAINLLKSITINELK